ncbi:hypothetical protein COT42_01885 [Candidatus Saganbacteria bacterium CG08_land_8_20_14_0_20_45_16]|uniref:ATP synthase gamma chain n=1 Tax=Candidatus Saganbacteria bacterium CG08_land_8_20_14_0_20_45_16 TaxID=2014293 RepID=A0A2H0Y0R2_UNCSA|nr:MAG: hypothetical protein COT42_01885 [Candidatus Saganbacteria bacterium CG08_land_8_20_14_0_20_45_16]
MSELILLRQKLKGIIQISKMAEAMQVVAVAELKKIQARQRNAHKFLQQYQQLAGQLKLNEMQRPKPDGLTTALFLFVSERGFCAGFNDSLIASAENFLKASKQEVKLVICGRKGGEGLRSDQAKKIGANDFDLLEEEAMLNYDLYLKGRVGSIYFLFNEFKSMMVQTSLMQQVLPFDWRGKEKPVNGGLIVEPDLESVSSQVGVNFYRAFLYDAYMQTRLGEVAARLLTMRGATESCKEMIKNLQIKINKARQAMITVELSEILSSFKVLAKEG